MQLKVIEEKANPLYNRKEVSAVMEFDSSTPSRKQVLAELLKKYGGSDDTVVIREVRQNFGRKEVLVKVMVYANAESAKKSEHPSMVKRTKESEKTAAKAAA